MSSLFFVVAVAVAGFLGAAITPGDSKIKGGASIIYATGFVLACALIGHLLDINPAKIITACGLALAAWFVGSMFFSRKEQ